MGSSIKVIGKQFKYENYLHYIQHFLNEFASKLEMSILTWCLNVACRKNFSCFDIVELFFVTKAKLLKLNPSAKADGFKAWAKRF